MSDQDKHDPDDTRVIRVPGGLAKRPAVRRYDPGTAPVSWDRTPERREEYPPPPAMLRDLQAQNPEIDLQRVQPDRRWVPWLIIVLALVLVLVGLGIVLRHSNKIPAAFPVIGRDPGVDLCVGIASGAKAPTGAEAGKPMTQETYLAARDAMSKVRNEDVRAGVVSIVDMAWALQGTPGLAFGMGGDLATAYGRMTTGCATYGITLPPFSSQATVD